MLRYFLGAFLALSLAGQSFGSDPEETYLQNYLSIRDGAAKEVRCQIPGLEGDWILYLEDGKVAKRRPAESAPTPKAEKAKAAPAPRNSVSAKDARNAACSIMVMEGDTQHHGSGTVIASSPGRSLILTNAHVVPHGRNPIFVANSGYGELVQYPARYVGGSAVINLSPGLIQTQGPDLALLEVDAELPAVELSPEDPEIGSRVWQYGFAGNFGSKPQSKPGQVIATRKLGVLATTCATVGGDSGSGLFDDSERLVGVAWGNDGESTAVRLTDVHVFTVRTAGDHRVKLFPILRAIRDRVEAKGMEREYHQAARTVPTKSPAPAQSPVKQASDCPNGQCPLSSPSVVNGGYYAPFVPTFGNCPNGQCPNAGPSIIRRYR